MRYCSRNHCCYLPSYSIVDLGNDFDICVGTETTLTASPLNASYLWNDNSTLATLTITETGSYWVKSTLNNCEGSDTITIGWLPTPIANIGNDSTICENKPVVLDATYPDASYLWGDNSSNATLEVNATGEYWVQVTLGFCSQTDTIYFDQIACEVILEMPNIFTPNDDAINDLFHPNTITGVDQMATQIFSRWSQEIYTTTDPAINWDGTNKNGNPSPTGVYFWIISISGEDGSSHAFKGELTLLR